jgi:hypothetical protein
MMCDGKFDFSDYNKMLKSYYRPEDYVFYGGYLYIPYEKHAPEWRSRCFMHIDCSNTLRSQKIGGVVTYSEMEKKHGNVASQV